MHGREAYRRNSLLILYSFYKNVLYVVVQFYFGFQSAFAGQTMYEKFIYQLYNITFTSFPIIWYAVFDFQYHKDRPEDARDLPIFLEGDQNYFMRNPRLYKLGMEGKCFGKMEMSKWVVYALWHAVVVYMVCFYALTEADPQNSPKMENGMDLGFCIAGHVVYGVNVFIANLVLVHKFHHHHWQGFALIFLMVFSFFDIIAIESEWPSVTLFADVSHIFKPMFSQLLVWLTILFACG